MLDKGPERVSEVSRSHLFMICFVLFAALAGTVSLVAGFSLLYILDGVLEFFAICWLFYMRDPDVLKNKLGATLKMVATAFAAALGAVILVSKAGAISSVLAVIVALACLILPIVLFMKK